MIESAVPQLLDLACASRRDWDRDALDGAIVAALSNGWGWTRVLAETVRMIADEQASPRDLLSAARDPLNAPAGQVPGVYERGGEYARQLLAEALGRAS